MNTYKSVSSSFAQAMTENGITPPSNLIGDSKLHRFYVDGDRKGSLNGAYTLHLDARPSGWAMSFKTGVNFNWTLSGKREPMSAELIKQIEYIKQVREQEQAEAHAKTAERARWIWGHAKPIKNQSHFIYLITKRIQPHGARLWRGSLVNQLIDESGAIATLQFIGVDGTKNFLKGGRKRGCFATIGEATSTILICEGWATGASLHEATGLFVVVALDAGNLEPVSKIIKRLFPDSSIIICGDNDDHGKGQTAANRAALAVGGKVFIPPIPGDWNDYVNLEDAL